MTKVAYLDCPTGISGDMCLGALVHAGVPLTYLSEKLEQLGLKEEYHLHAEFVQRRGQQATQVHVVLTSTPDGMSETQPQPRSHAHAVSAVTHTQAPHASESVSLESQESQANSHASQSHASQSHVAPHRAAHSHTAHSHTAHSHTAAFPEQIHSHTRHLPEIESLILAAHLPDRVTQWSLAIFRRLAEAEAAVHGIPPQQVHFHEVGATDAIVDIVGTCLGLDWLEVEQLYCSALPVGGGTVWAAHGRLPVPAPAVLKLFEMGQVPLYSNQIQQELVTPTGAAIVTTLAQEFGALPPMRLQNVGLGAGTKDFPIPNILRLWIGETESPPGSTTLKLTDRTQPLVSTSNFEQANLAQETITVLETQIDDLNPQAIGYVLTELLAAGALDVFTQAIGMKKSRPAVLLSVICSPGLVPVCEAILFRETTTLGIRRSNQQRTRLDRSLETVMTPLGSVHIKVARNGGAIVNVQPEFEDCAELARQHRLPWKEIHQLALQSWYTGSVKRPENVSAPEAV